jgi:hypothetical protein
VGMAMAGLLVAVLPDRFAHFSTIVREALLVLTGLTALPCSSVRSCGWPGRMSTGWRPPPASSNGTALQPAAAHRLNDFGQERIPGRTRCSTISFELNPRRQRAAGETAAARAAAGLAARCWRRPTPGRSRLEAAAAGAPPHPGGPGTGDNDAACRLPAISTCRRAPRLDRATVDASATAAWCCTLQRGRRRVVCA